MKNIRFILTALLASLFAVACEEQPIDDLRGVFDDIERYDFTAVEQLPTEKVGKGIKALIIHFKDAEGNTMKMRIGSAEWTLKAGTYAAVGSVTADKTFAAELGDARKIASGNLNINFMNDIYLFSGLLKTEDGTEIQCNYRGALTFEVGVDDPEASGYTAILSVSPVYITDQSGNVTGIAPGVSKYAFSISDPNGANIALFETINAENLDAAALAGEYTVKDNALEAWSMASGLQMPQEWGGWSWGSYIVNAEGGKEFLSAGSKITVSAVDGIEGNKLYSFTGSGLSTSLTMNADGSITPGTLKEIGIKFVTLLQSTGIELRDQQLTSTVLGKETRYSVYLPKGYFEGTKTYPVLYLLNGADGNHNDWLQQGMVNPYASTLAAEGGAEMIVVCPNGCPDGQNVFYCDNFQGNGVNYMTYFFDEFIPFIESTSRVKADRASRAVAGLSMGGYGALYYGFLHQEMFCCVYACSPATYVEGAPNLYTMQPTADLPELTLEIGRQDFLYQSAKAYHDGMTSAGIAHAWIERDGTHDWAFWTACTPKILRKASESFR